MEKIESREHDEEVLCQHNQCSASFSYPSLGFSLGLGDHLHNDVEEASRITKAEQGSSSHGPSPL